MRRTTLFLRREEGDPVRVIVERRKNGCRVIGEESAEDADVALLPDGRLSMILDGARQLSGRGRKAADGVIVTRSGQTALVPMTATRFASARPSGDAGGSGVEEIRALMHGRIVEVCVASGDRVEQGALLLVLEAMKMQNEIRASRSGTVERAQVAAGQTVEGGAFLLSIRSEIS